MSWSFRLLLPALTLLAQVYWAVRIWSWVGRKLPGRFWARIVVAGCLLFLALPYMAIAFRSPLVWDFPGALGMFHRMASAVWLLGSVLGCVVMILFDLLRLGLRAILPRRTEAPVDYSRRQFVQTATAAVGLAPWVIVTYGVSAGRLRHVVERVPVFIPNLPEPFERFHILQLTDIHISEYMSARQIDRFVEAASEIEADLAVLTGDYLSWDQRGLDDCVAVLSRIASRNGIVGCLGNHEIYTDAQDRISRAFERSGVDILRDELRTLERENARLHVVGVDYQRVSRGYLKNVPGLLVPGETNLLLSHNPNVFPAATALGIELTLSGHTHGGQVHFEILDQEFAPSRILSPYVKGLYRAPKGQLYVSRGIGTTGPPIRLGAPPEITLLELRRA